MIRVGDVAPGFTLPGTGGRDYTLAEERGHVVVLAFYPGDDTPVCTRQLSSYSADLAQFSGLGARLFGISPQDVASHERFAAKHGLEMVLLADVEKQVAAAYGILGPLGFYRRSVFVIDAGGTVRFAHRSFVGATYVRSGEVEAAIRAAAAA
jgi:peroxiredoxin Q/BCP